MCSSHHDFWGFFNIKFATDVIFKSLYIWRKCFTLYLVFIIFDTRPGNMSTSFTQNFAQGSGLPKMFSWPSLKTAFQSEVNLDWIWDNFTDLNRNTCNLSSLSID